MAWSRVSQPSKAAMGSTMWVVPFWRLLAGLKEIQMEPNHVNVVPLFEATLLCVGLKGNQNKGLQANIGVPLD